MEYFKLNNGISMPKMGIGTFLLEPDDAEEAVYNALKDGYKLIDTANAYMNEKAVGRGIKKSGVDRKDIFLVTKLWPSVYTDDNAVDETLKRLDTDYIDLLLLHQPAGNYLQGYKNMEKAYKEGKVKAIGLSNFEIPQLKEVLETCEIKPQVLQFEAHPYYTEDEIKEFLKPYNMVYMAWYPLGHGDKSLVNEEVFTKLAKKYNKTNAQIILRWHTQVGHVVIPGSKNPDHIKSNLDIFDFTLTDEELSEISSINKNKRYYHATKEALDGYAAFRPDFNSQK